MNNRLLAILLVLFTLNSYAFAEDIESLRKSIVEIHAQSVEPDYAHPWQFYRTTSGRGSGVVISGNRILTAAHVIDYAEQIKVRKPGSDQLFDANLLFVSDASDLAILTITNPDFFEDTTPVDLGELPKLGDVVTTVGFPTGGSQLALTKGVVSRIDFDDYAHSKASNLVIQIDAAINPGASGGGAFINGKLAGVTFQGLSGDDVENIGYIIPTPVVRQFFEDIKDNVVNGVPALGISTQSMHNEQLREYYNMPAGMTGLLVITSIMNAANTSDVLLTDDIILSMDKQPVGNDGMVAFQSGDRMDLAAALRFRQIGELFELEILRQGKKQSISILLQEQNISTRPVKTHASTHVPDYVVIGGLVIQELSFDYIDQYFTKTNTPAWMKVAMDDFYDSPTKTRYLFISAVLPHASNTSYEGFEDVRITKVNETVVNNLEDLRRILNASDAQPLKLELDNGKVIVFNRESLVEIDRELKEKFNY
jgi:S1-C subfamily serine protease